MLKVYYPQPPYSGTHRDSDKGAWEILESKLDPDITIYTGLEIPDPADYHILICGRPTVAQLDASPDLHTLLIPWAGLPVETAEVMPMYPRIAIHNLHHNAITTAETALTLMMAAAKHLIPIERSLRAHDWTPRYQPNPAVILAGKTALILGYGHIGRHIGRVCAAMGMRILGIRANPVEDPIADVHPPEALHDLLPKANILFITLPLTSETRGMIGEKEIRLLPMKAVVVNVGRGAVLDQHALYRALEDGHLHSAGLDVWYNYPPDEESRTNTPPADVPFHELDNIVMSPHRGGGSAEIEVRRMQHLAHCLNLAAAGAPLPNKINLERGY
jgi:phosphoglycerate dehydrogenase-like enzyme